MIDILITVVLIILLCGVFAWLVQAAPIIPDPYKAAAVWFILIICFVWVLAALFGSAPLFHFARVR